MKTKKLLACMLAVGMVLPATAGNVFAADRTGQTPVTYDNRNYIPDPDENNPTDATWAVTIPSAIIFTDTDRDIAADVELVGVNGGDVPENKDVKVEVASTNGYKLKGIKDELKYTLTYTSEINAEAGVKAEIGTLNKTNPKIPGRAVLENKTAKERASYTDTLTYTITTNP